MEYSNFIIIPNNILSVHVVKSWQHKCKIHVGIQAKLLNYEHLTPL